LGDGIKVGSGVAVQQMVATLLREITMAAGRRAEMERLCDALRAVVEQEEGDGDASVSDEWTEGLTPRQRQVVELLLAGRSNAEIAEELQIQPATVRDHLRAIYARLGVTSRFELMAQARQRSG